MKRGIIFANGMMEVSPKMQAEIQSSSLIIAADGGVHNCKSLGLQPDVIIGDLDSMDAEEIKTYRAANTEVIQYPTHKNETDLELALHYAVKHELNETIILGGLGARWDMTISNILLLTNPAFNSINIRFLHGNQELLILRAGESFVINGSVGDTVSLIPLAGDASGITTNGLEYLLSDEMLLFGTARGVSNVLTQENAQIFFREGLLLCIMIRESDNVNHQ